MCTGVSVPSEGGARCVPGPASWALLACGLCMMGCIRSRAGQCGVKAGPT